MSLLKVSEITDLTGNGSVYAPGHVVQVVSVAKTDTFASTSTSFTDVTSLSVSITPKYASSLVVITSVLNFGSNTTASPATARMLRNGSPILVGDSAGSRTLANAYYDAKNYTIDSVSFAFLDSPATTSSVTYKWQVKADVAPGTVVVNRGYDDESAVTRARTGSSIILMEIAQ